MELMKADVHAQLLECLGCSNAELVCNQVVFDRVRYPDRGLEHLRARLGLQAKLPREERSEGCVDGARDRNTVELRLEWQPARHANVSKELLGPRKQGKYANCKALTDSSDHDSIRWDMLELLVDNLIKQADRFANPIYLEVLLFLWRQDVSTKRILYSRLRTRVQGPKCGFPKATV